MKKKPRMTVNNVFNKGYTDVNVLKSLLAKKVCGFCGHLFARHRGDKCLGEQDCFCERFERKPGDAL